MPAFPHHLLPAIASRQEAPGPFQSPANTTGPPHLQVICAWPVSGQYGPGSRVLYYVLVAACVFARKVDWLRNACLAGALLLPVVAALHGIVLAAVHNDHAVDMDVYGAFQICAIGALAAPVTVRISRTYFNDPGRNTIFAWSCIVLAGLLSLTVEFYRSHTSSCPVDEFGGAISLDPGRFPYGNATCNLTCDETWPKSPIRGGSANNIYVIPAPTRLTFDAATLLAAACCIPAILLCVWMWIKILKDNSNRQDDPTNQNATQSEDQNEGNDGPGSVSSSDTVSETSENTGRVNRKTRALSTGTEILVLIFGAAVLTILVVGEWNLFSSQVSFQTEPLANIGQWQPIIGTGLVVLASLYLLLAQAMQQERNTYDPDPCPEVKLVHSFPHEVDVYMGELVGGDRAVLVVNTADSERLLKLPFSLLGIQSASVRNVLTGRAVPVVHSYDAKIAAHAVLSLRLSSISITPPRIAARPISTEPMVSTIASEQSKEHAEHHEEVVAEDEEEQCRTQRSLLRGGGIIRQVARVMIRFSDYIGKPRQGRFGPETLSSGKAANYPTFPGEELVNPDLVETRSKYGDRRASVDSQMLHLSRQISRPRSGTAGSGASGSRSGRSSSEKPTTQTKRKDTITTLASEPGALGRRDTLEVPTSASPVRAHTRNSLPATDEIFAIPGNPITITVSSEDPT